ncbi:dihydroxyacetone kinase subunit DhaL [Streptococcus macacae]|uniref:phosphoenolpyruvate--glycerone phosphotransferase n=1 Tax=Streptococcus macacae NCTC 11558 TaxID=764298 RepID=G5JVW1_9STRE|nr:dihydroxyacetone kinase subunit DhaL [Streptococcus macacae]EHJ51579.1 dihydroxyacetone kinase, L subunit [Streptococcus macacae NCTC 11558]SUN78952.1 dihydroxyacetone kinase domain-containing protein [Streptococcus macacae NCTC 11558]
MEVTVAKRWMSLFNDKIQANKDYLSELDTPIGDGDHGSNMARGMTAVMEAMSTQELTTAADVFKATAMQLLRTVGGASGPLYASAFMGMMDSEQAGGDIIDDIKAGLDMIKKRGKANINEKTMVDVWACALADLETNTLTAPAIKKMVEETKEMKATKGRASYVGERSAGHIDPGSYSSGLLFEALIEAEDL